jgi:peroxiredoxin
MAKVELNAFSPDFTLSDHQGISYSLHQFIGNNYVLLVFNRGFT